MAGMQVLGTTCELLIAPESCCLWEDRKEESMSYSVERYCVNQAILRRR